MDKKTILSFFLAGTMLFPMLSGTVSANATEEKMYKLLRVA